MRKIVPIAAAFAVAGLLASCGGGRRLGGGPNEFAVARQAPLVIPPSFSLVPPQPGAPRPQDNNPSQQALDAMFGGPAARSASETATLTEAGRDQADPGIRSAVGDAGTNVVDKGSTTRDIVAAPEGDGQSARATTP
ncbi:beta-barrel assembly complex subunit BamF [Hephaestia caeni]|uniref:Beta-barrel assembly complex subunit BamF n=1 Tax=Hephaestia caeni TaxID=645617 RepID=A0A397NS64_9SPHN|nr:DUF3035 domain-containing protein [Hephaestia caeni]RIA37545.1 beta-barrel assembly complex subunit BamF [Hephaestia caeni]